MYGNQCLILQINYFHLQHILNNLIVLYIFRVTNKLNLIHKIFYWILRSKNWFIFPSRLYSLNICPLKNLTNRIYYFLSLNILIISLSLQNLKMPFTCPRQELRMIHTVTHYSLLDHAFRYNGRLVSRRVCSNNRFFAEHVIQQSEARIAHTDKLVVSKRWNSGHALFTIRSRIPWQWSSCVTLGLQQQSVLRRTCHPTKRSKDCTHGQAGRTQTLECWREKTPWPSYCVFYCILAW